MAYDALPGQAEYLEQAVLVAYAEGVKDTLLMVERGMYQQRLDRIHQAQERSDMATFLRLTHGLLA